MFRPIQIIRCPFFLVHKYRIEKLSLKYPYRVFCGSHVSQPTTSHFNGRVERERSRPIQHSTGRWTVVAINRFYVLVGVTARCCTGRVRSNEFRNSPTNSACSTSAGFGKERGEGWEEGMNNTETILIFCYTVMGVGSTFWLRYYRMHNRTYACTAREREIIGAAVCP